MSESLRSQGGDSQQTTVPTIDNQSVADSVKIPNSKEDCYSGLKRALHDFRDQINSGWRNKAKAAKLENKSGDQVVKLVVDIESYLSETEKE